MDLRNYWLHREHPDNMGIAAEKGAFSEAHPLETVQGDQPIHSACGRRTDQFLPSPGLLYFGSACYLSVISQPGTASFLSFLLHHPSSEVSALYNQAARGLW